MSDPTASGPWRIGAAARLSGLSAANIRFYEKELPLPAYRADLSSYRLYSKADVQRLRRVALMRRLDLSLDEMRALLGLSAANAADCTRASTVVAEHLEHVRARQRELRALARELRALQAACAGAGEPGTPCGLLRALDDAAAADSPRPTVRRRGHV